MLLPNILDLIAKYSGNTYIDNKKTSDGLYIDVLSIRGFD